MRILSFPITFHSLYPSRYLREERTCGILQAATAHVAADAFVREVLLVLHATADEGVRGSTILLNNLRNRSRAHRVPAFANGKPQALLHRHRRNQFDYQAEIVA